MIFLAVFGFLCCAALFGFGILELSRWLANKEEKGYFKGKFMGW